MAKKLLDSNSVWYEKFCRSRRVLPLRSFAPSILALRPRHCYLKYPRSKRSSARDWGKGSRWKRVWDSPTYEDSSTFKVHSFPTSNSLEVPKVEYMKWWFFFYIACLIKHVLFLIYCIFLFAGPQNSTKTVGPRMAVKWKVVFFRTN